MSTDIPCECILVGSCLPKYTSCLLTHRKQKYLYLIYIHITYYSTLQLPQMIIYFMIKYELPTKLLVISHIKYTRIKFHVQMYHVNRRIYVYLLDYTIHNIQCNKKL